MRKTKWRKRTQGTKRQIGKPFPLETESQQGLKRKLHPTFGERLAGVGRSKRLEYLLKRLRPKEDNLLDSEILTPDDVEFMQKRGYLDVDDSDNIQLTAKAIERLRKLRMRKKPDEYDSHGEPKEYKAEDDKVDDVW